MSLLVMTRDVAKLEIGVLASASLSQRLMYLIDQSDGYYTLNKMWTHSLTQKDSAPSTTFK